MVRNEQVNFYWTNRRDTINISSLQKEQITNHFAKAGSLTTKVHLQQALWSFLNSNSCLLMLPLSWSPSISVLSVTGGVVCESEEPVLVWLNWSRHLLPPLLPTRSPGREACFYWSDITLQLCKLNQQLTAFYNKANLWYLRLCFCSLYRGLQEDRLHQSFEEHCGEEAGGSRRENK